MGRLHHADGAQSRTRPGTRLTRTLQIVAVTAATVVLAAGCNMVPDPEVTLPQGWVAGVTKTSTAEYAPGLEVDVFAPTGPHIGVISYFHGGGFFEGDRSQVPQTVLRQVERGWLVYSFDYRLGPEHRFATGLQDADRAVQWAMNAWPGARHVAWGHSAGGYLAGSAASAASIPWVGYAPVTNFGGLGTRGAPWSMWAGLSRNAWEPPANAAIQFDPARSEPAYLVHGARDPVVHADQSTYVGLAGHVHEFDVTFDYVDTGPVQCQGHLPECGMNVEALDAWLDERSGP